jgi:hypothetical protein
VIGATTVVEDWYEGLEAEDILVGHTARLERFRAEMEGLFLCLRGEQVAFARKPSINLTLIMAGEPPAKLIVLPAWDGYQKQLDCSKVRCEMLAEWDYGGGCRQWEQRATIRLDGGRPAVLLYGPTIRDDLGRIAATIGDYLDDRRAVLARSCDRCCICDKYLTDPQSRGRGIGPECIRKFAGVGPSIWHSIVTPESSSAVGVDEPGSLTAHATGGRLLPGAPESIPPRPARTAPKGVKATLYTLCHDWRGFAATFEEEIMFVSFEVEAKYLGDSDVPVVHYREPRKRRDRCHLKTDICLRLMLVVEGWGHPDIPGLGLDARIEMDDRSRYRSRLHRLREGILEHCREAGCKVLVDVRDAIDMPYSPTVSERRQIDRTVLSHWSRHKAGEISRDELRALAAADAFAVPGEAEIMLDHPAFLKDFTCAIWLAEADDRWREARECETTPDGGTRATKDQVPTT